MAPRQYTVAVQGQNLTDRASRSPPRVRHQSYYLLPARLLMLSVAADLRR